MVKKNVPRKKVKEISTRENL